MRYIHCLGPYITWLLGILLFSISANTYFPKTEQVQLHTDKALYCRFPTTSQIKKIKLSKPVIKKDQSNPKRHLEIVFKNSEPDHKTFECYKEQKNYRCDWTAYNYLTIPFLGRKISEDDKTGGEFIARWFHNAFDIKGEQIFCYQF